MDWIRETREETLEMGFDKPFDGVLFSFGLHREPGTYHAVIFTPAAGSSHRARCVTNNPWVCFPPL